LTDLTCYRIASCGIQEKPLEIKTNLDAFFIDVLVIIWQTL